MRAEDFYFIDENLQESPKDRALVQDRVAELNALLVDEDNSKNKIRVLGELAFLHRILGEFVSAEKALSNVAEILDHENHETRYQIVNEIRVATLRQWQSRFDEADEIFQRVCDLCSIHSQYEDLLDFCLQHQGKNYFDQEKYNSSIECFEKALQLRIVKNDPELIQSTQFALSVARRRSKGGSVK